MIKLIFSDIDGAILPRRGEVSPAAVAAVRACEDDGVARAIRKYVLGDE